jgi:hypothetical protein
MKIYKMLTYSNKNQKIQPMEHVAIQFDRIINFTTYSSTFHLILSSQVHSDLQKQTSSIADSSLNIFTPGFKNSPRVAICT